MEITFDEAKDEANILKHRVSLREAARFIWDTARIEVDRRKDYEEERKIAVGFIGSRLYVLVFTMRQGTLRAISLRKANERERKKYEEK